LDNVCEALEKSHIGQREKEEVRYIAADIGVVGVAAWRARSALQP
jgi:hypothetical protein